MRGWCLSVLLYLVLWSFSEAGKEDELTKSTAAGSTAYSLWQHVIGGASQPAQGSAEAPPEALAEAPAEVPAEAQAEVPAEALAEVPAEAPPAEAPAETAPAEASAQGVVRQMQHQPLQPLAEAPPVSPADEAGSDPSSSSQEDVEARVEALLSQAEEDHQAEEAERKEREREERKRADAERRAEHRKAKKEQDRAEKEQRRAEKDQQKREEQAAREQRRAEREEALIAERVAQGVRHRVNEIAQEGDRSPLILQLLAALWRRQDVAENVLTQALAAQQEQNRVLREYIGSATKGLQEGQLLAILDRLIPVIQSQMAASLAPPGRQAKAETPGGASAAPGTPTVRARRMRCRKCAACCQKLSSEEVRLPCETWKEPVGPVRGPDGRYQPRPPAPPQDEETKSEAKSEAQDEGPKGKRKREARKDKKEKDKKPKVPEAPDGAPLGGRGPGGGGGGAGGAGVVAAYF